MNDHFGMQPTSRFLQECDPTRKVNNALQCLAEDEQYQFLTEKMSELLSSEVFSTEPSTELLSVMAERNNRRKSIFAHFGVSVTESVTGRIELKHNPREQDFARAIRKIVQDAVYCTCSRGKGCEYYDDILYCIDCGKVIRAETPLL